MSVTITFLGGTGTVTGSKYLVQHADQKLLVDCGLFQGYKQLRLRNWNPLHVAPKEINAVVLTHAHLDHSGYIPLIYAQGYRGKVHASAATCDLCNILLPDSGHIQEEDAEFLNRHGYSKHEPALPLYDKHQAIQSLGLLKPESMGKPFSPIAGWKVTLSSAGHILGASSVLVEVAGRRILFSGDLGRPDDLLMPPPDQPPLADTVLIESTYGNREHPEDNVIAELGNALKKVSARGGVAVRDRAGDGRLLGDRSGRGGRAAGRGALGRDRTPRGPRQFRLHSVSKPSPPCTAASTSRPSISGRPRSVSRSAMPLTAASAAETVLAHRP